LPQTTDGNWSSDSPSTLARTHAEIAILPIKKETIILQPNIFEGASDYQ
jgi:hypothetical protein